MLLTWSLCWTSCSGCTTRYRLTSTMQGPYHFQLFYPGHHSTPLLSCQSPASESQVPKLRLHSLVPPPDSGPVAQAEQAEQKAWETQCVLLLWLSQLVLIPFDLALVDSTCPSPAAMQPGWDLDHSCSQPAGTQVDSCIRFLVSPARYLVKLLLLYKIRMLYCKQSL